MTTKKPSVNINTRNDRLVVRLERWPDCDHRRAQNLGHLEFGQLGEEDEGGVAFVYQFVDGEHVANGALFCLAPEQSSFWNPVFRALRLEVGEQNVMPDFRIRPVVARSSPWETEHMDHIFCPHCGANEGFNGHVQTRRDEKRRCSACRRSFVCSTFVTTTYSTRKS